MTNDTTYEIMKLGFDSKNQVHIRETSVKFYNDRPVEVRLDGVKVFEMVRLQLVKKVLTTGSGATEIMVLVGHAAYAIHSFNPNEYQYSAFLRDVELSDYEFSGPFVGRDLLSSTLDHIIAKPLRTTLVV